ncbi:PAS domain S-box protein [uncultured Methanoregula sp.]|uniref:PAS domain S-box protein n=1 Tax=uncultured Methanoregula sp. TaxID=1005933 RepID=UPI002AABE5E8|nr:PAS domain S-box protein [uncultured Methanoregula sp.]
MISVLYVDDEPDLLGIGKIFLEQSGQLSVDIITSAPEALSLMASRRYDAVIADYQMPEMNGIEFLKVVRRDSGTIPFILFTGRGREEIVIEAINNGADFYLQKGGDPRSQFAELEHKTKSAVERRKAEAALVTSVERLGMAQEIGQIGSWEYELETRMIWASEQAFRLFGFNRPSGTVPFDDIKACYVDKDTVYDHLVASISRGEYQDIEYAINPADGSAVRIIHSVAKPVRDADGKITKLSGVIQDITDKKLAELALRESEEKHRLLLDESSDPIFSFYPDGTYRYVNRAFAEGVGKTVDEITGKRISDVFSKDEAEKRFFVLRGVFSSGEQKVFEVRVPHPDGDRYYLTTVSPIKDESGAVLSVICSSKEITDRRNAENELRESEEKFRSFVVNANDIVYTLSLDGTFTYASPNTTDLLGYAASEVIGMPLDRLIHPDDLAACRTFLAAILSKGEKKGGVEYRVRHKDGTWRWFMSNNSLLRDHENKPFAFLGIARDITLKKQMDESLADQVLFQQALIDSIPYPVFIKDFTGRFAGCNRAYEREFGTTRDYLVGKTVLDLEYLPMDERQRFHEEDTDVIAKTGRKRYELPIVYADGMLHQTLYSVDGFSLADGRPGGLIGIMVDITDRKRMEDAIRQANRQLSLLTSITRHDINNNIMGILGYLDLVELESSDPAIGNYISKLKSFTNAIQAQIAFTKIYQGIGSQEPWWQELDSLLTCRNVQKTIDLHAYVHGFEVFADPLLPKVFFNLYDNTIRHGERATLITVSASVSPAGLVIVWEDNGVGIVPDQKEKIFERGFGKNTGLGLFLVREILSLTGITIRETGIAGKGARFEILVPKGAYRQNPSGKTAGETR